jgi:pyruvate decarboxylase
MVPRYLCPLFETRADPCIALLIYGQPVYIGIPTDLTFEEISDVGLCVPLFRSLDPNNQELEAKILSDIRSRLEASSNPVIVVDGGKRLWLLR